MRRRKGLSRIEVVLVILIVMTVTALVAVAVARLREEAARVSCTNNLRQIGLAALNYQDVSERLPPLVDQGEGAPIGKGLPSLFFMLTPYIEAAPVLYRPGRSPPEAYHSHSSVPFSYTDKEGTPGTEFGGAANQVWRRYFIDPADTTADKLRDVPITLPDGSTGYYAIGNYAANGLLPWGKKGVREGFPNGTENTILFAERLQVCRDSKGNVTHTLWGLGFYSPHMPAFAALAPKESPELLSTGQAAPVLPLPDDRDATVQVRIGRHDAEPLYPDFSRPFQLFGANQPSDPRLPVSPHRTGMQLLMASGSVRTFGPDTTSWVFWTACGAK